jgi:hypothetical protein
MSLQRFDDDERALNRLMARAKILARMPGLKKELAGSPEAVAAVMLSLQGEGLPVTLRNVNSRYHFIEGQAVDSAAAITALAFRHGYRIEQLVATDELAVVAIHAPSGDRTEIAYSAADAEAAGHLDEWVEIWTRDGDRNRKQTWTVRRNGVTLDDPPWPEWAARAVADGKTKRFDAWWKYRADMLYKSAAVRAVRRGAPEVLLGGEPGPGEDPPPAGTVARGSAAVAGQDIIDVEAVDDVPDDPGRPFT